MTKPTVAMGIDLSLRGLGVAVIPAAWDLDPRRAKAHTLGLDLKRDASPAERVERLEKLVNDVSECVRHYGVTHAWVESYAFNQTSMAHSLGEIGGAVKLDLYRRFRIVVQTANQTRARHLVYGQLPPRGITDKQRKAWLLEPLRLAGLTLDDHNQGDAFVAVSFGLLELGAPALTNLLGPAPKKPKAPRKRKTPPEMELF